MTVFLSFLAFALYGQRPVNEKPAPPDPPPDTCTLSGKLQFKRPEKSATQFQDIVVYVSKKPPVEADERETFAVEQRDYDFRPPVLIVQEDDVLTFPNSDRNPHAVNAESLFNIDPNTAKTPEPITVPRLGPIHIRCNRHRWMRAEILSIPIRRFHTRVAADGSWSLQGLPRKKVSIRAWEPNGGLSEELKVDPCSTADTVLVLDGKNPPALKAKPPNPADDYP